MRGQFIRHKIKKFRQWLSGKISEVKRWYLNKRISTRNFTIISNNCWAGSVYRYFNMPYMSPTVGLYFFADDYLKFIKNLRFYLGLELQFTSALKSKYKTILEERKQLDVPIGVLGDIEVIFLHYHSEQEAKEKWERRTQRINWNNLFIKFSRMNLCTDEHIEEFCNLPYKNKFVFNINRNVMFDSEYYWAGEKNNTEIILDTTPFPGNISLVKLLGRKAEKYPVEGLRKY